MTIGVLALQGDFDAHRRCLEELGATVHLVRKPEQLDRVAALVIPGGESSTFLNFLERDNFWEKLRAFVRSKPAFGTCAGAILLASEVENPVQQCLGALDISVQRNAYGRQLQSAIHQVETSLGGDPLELVFIRAPQIVRVGSAVTVLLRQDGYVAAVADQHGILATVFHPELSDSLAFHRYFATRCGLVVRAEAPVSQAPFLAGAGRG